MAEIMERSRHLLRLLEDVPLAPSLARRRRLLAEAFDIVERSRRAAPTEPPREP